MSIMLRAWNVTIMLQAKKLIYASLMGSKPVKFGTMSHTFFIVFYSCLHDRNIFLTMEKTLTLFRAC